MLLDYPSLHTKIYAQYKYDNTSFQTVRYMFISSVTRKHTFNLQISVSFVYLSSVI